MHTYQQVLLLQASSLHIPICTAILAWWYAGYGAKAASGRAFPNRKHFLLDEGIDNGALAITGAPQEGYLHLFLLSCLYHCLQAVPNLGACI